MRLRSGNLVGGIAVLGLVGIMLAMLFPWCLNKTSALDVPQELPELVESFEPSEVVDGLESEEAVEDTTEVAEETITNANTASNDVTMRTSQPSSVAVALQNILELDVSANDGFSASAANLTVRAEQVEDYAVFLQTEDGSTAMRPRDQRNQTEIASITEQVTGNDFPNDAWGYNLRPVAATEEMLFSPIPGTQTEIARQDVAADGVQIDQWQLSFGMKLSTATPADTYSTTVMVTVVAKPVATGMDSITYMQEMTPEVCAQSELEKAYTLIDNRDNQTYTVKRLKDENCWMMNNLRLTSQSVNAVKKNQVLTPLDSDVTESWAMPTTLTSFSSGSWPISYTAAASINYGNNYGTYFTFNAATADTAKTSNGNIASGSVCPYGWKLPLSGNHLGSYNATNGSFYYLFNLYSIENQDAASVNILKNTLGFSLGGVVKDTGIDYVGASGFYWSSVSRTGTVAYGFQFSDPNYTNPSSSYERRWGKPVRCLAR